MHSTAEPPSFPPLTASTLYLVATPIGNLEDLTPRALRTLKECDVVAAEDTRRAGLLLRRFDVRRPLLSYHRFNEARRGGEILARLGRGEKVALITDAGVPGISDPGQRVVAEAVAAGFRVESVPGACAFVTALAASGLPTDEFHFVGFLPHKSGQRRRELERLRSVPGTLVLYESPYRVERLLEELVEILPDRAVVLARELTKKFEEIVRGRPAELLTEARRRHWKGEFTVLVGPEGASGPGLGGIRAASPPAGEAGARSARAVDESSSGAVRLAMAQMRVEPGRPGENLDRAEALIRRAREEGASLVLLPEVLDFGWTDPSALEGAGGIPDGESFARLSAAAAREGIHVCAGLAERHGERLFNAAVLLGPDGELLLHHRKIHEIPFARALYATGNRLGVVETALGRIGVMICADALAPDRIVPRTLGEMGAEFVVSPCAWAVPPDHDNARSPYGGLWLEAYGPVARARRGSGVFAVAGPGAATSRKGRDGEGLRGRSCVKSLEALS
ncbi:MAG: 16S rRNA (cytidine(1402)-2'-O)-methyltransferase [Verrucomicrobiales bacterium]|nr:16S rRNA (cytidine(1402)-2'-O)-methyltransferase [Verrucomicrobiales bacterium]